jgi:hypothetical protein
MSSTYSNLKIQLMTTGENNATWGDVTNVNLGTAIEEAIVGSADVTFASADITLTLANTNSSQTARNLRLRCTGTTGGATRNLVVPSIEKPYIIQNDCADSILVKTAAGTGITVTAGTTKWVFVDGTNVVNAVNTLSGLACSQNIQSGNYTLALTDSGGHIYSANTGAQTVTIPTNATVAFPLGTLITIVNMGTTNILLGATGVSVYANGSTTTSPYPAVIPGNSVQLMKTGTDTWQGTFGSISNTQITYLSVAGGGGGGKPSSGGGGGAGGFVTGSTALASGTLTITVGAGGAAGVYLGTSSTAGSNSSITGTTAAVGGGRGGEAGNGGAGGSGGGGGGNNSSAFTGGAATSGQGFAGGAALAASYTGGGGGGAGAVGGNAVSNTAAGTGGVGLTSSITGSSVTYAGGGGGGAISGSTGASGGAGGGGTGGFVSTSGTAGTTNTGGGGGGGPANNPGVYSGGAGGSGVVIISSPVAATSTTGSPTITTVGLNTIYKFTASGTITW